ncbi:Holliday junction branch migration protein RuvA [Henriciella mobilis]|uniref:Holliday junction branch migration complex subunit RuvA n=1 Tax=Henriciella mobilis TaxID=2305467 RepID=A0A399RJD6_9PROT|nr:Holliday junction branch migration protein RuvA [Henriciella mobilis]
MIGRLRGEIATVGTDSVMIDVNGVGYVALAGGRLLGKLQPGKEATLHIETRVTENSITLFAFESDEARAWFVRLQDVPGVAGKSAMAIMDALSPAELQDALALGDAASITRAKGVGKKLAERIVGELAGKAPPMGRFGAFRPHTEANGAAPEAAIATGTRSETISALVNLGYSQSDAARAVATAIREKPDADTGTLIKASLKELAP